MRVFKFWRIAETTVLINDTVKPISCFGGSNHSESDALTDGHRRLEAVKRWGAISSHLWSNIMTKGQMHNQVYPSREA